jgi:hypothetical protein
VNPKLAPSIFLRQSSFKYLIDLLCLFIYSGLKYIPSSNLAQAKTSLYFVPSSLSH